MVAEVTPVDLLLKKRQALYKVRKSENIKLGDVEIAMKNEYGRTHSGKGEEDVIDQIDFFNQRSNHFRFLPKY